MKRFLWCMLSGMIVFGCGGDDDDGDSTPAESGSVTRLTEGTGPTNEEPLWPLVPGWRLGDEATILPPVSLDGIQVLPLASTLRLEGSATVEEGWAAPSEPGLELYLSQDGEGGVWIHGTPRLGRIEPALLLPSEVRVGMKWETGAFNGGTAFLRPDIGPCHFPNDTTWEGHECPPGRRLTIEVVARTMAETDYGLRPVWTLHATDWGRHIPSYDFNRQEVIFDGVAVELQIIEGRGPTSVPLYTAPVRRSGVTPLEPYTPPERARTIELEPLPGMEPFERQLTQRSGLYYDPALDEYRLSAIGVVASFSPAIIEDEPTIPMWQFPPASKCFGPGGGGWVVQDDCVVPDGVAVAASGDEATNLPLAADGSVALRDDELVALFETDGTFEVVERAPPGEQLPAGLLSVSPIAGRTTRGAIYGTPMEGEWYSSFDRAIGTFPTFAIGDAERVRLVEVGEGIRFAQLDRSEQRVRFDHRAYFDGPRLNHSVVPGGREVLLTSYSGRIERLHVRDDGIELETIGDVALPDGHFLAGAAVHEDDLIVLSMHSYAGIDPWFDRGYTPGRTTGLDRAFEPDLGVTHAWRADLPAPSASRRPSPVYGVEAEAFGLDVRVCWPPGSAAPELDGWTLGGHEPYAVSPVGDEGRCVLLTRDLAISDVVSVPSAWTVRGPIPGYGLAEIAVFQPPLVGSYLEPDRLARLVVDASTTAHGHVANSGWRTTSGGTWDPGDRNLLRAMVDSGGTLAWDRHWLIVQDLSGQGMWICSTFGDSPVVFWDGIEPSVFDGLDIDCEREIRGALAEGGGLLFDTFHLAPDGTQTTFPVGLEASFGDSPVIRFADGTLCGPDIREPPTASGERPVLCFDDDGTPREGPLMSATGFGGWFGQDGRFYTSDLNAFDPASMTVEPVDTDLLDLPPGIRPGGESDELNVNTALDPSGTVFAIISARVRGLTKHRLLKFGAAGPRRIERPELMYFADSTPSLVVDDEFFLFVVSSPDDSSELPATLRIPRDGDRGRPASDFRPGASGCVPIEDLESGQLTDAQWAMVRARHCGVGLCAERDELELAIERTPEEFFSLTCPMISLPQSAQLLGPDDRPVEGGLRIGSSTRYSPLDTFTRYTARDTIDGVPVEYEIQTLNVGQRVLRETPVDPNVGGLGPAPGPNPSCRNASPNNERSLCGMRTRFDPAHRHLLVENDGVTYLVGVDREAPLNVGIEEIPVGADAVFSPDGRLVFGDDAAWDTVEAELIELPSGRDTERWPVFALPEHPRVFFAMQDGTGVVMEWDRETGELSEVIATDESLYASFAGDGLGVVTMGEPEPDDYWVARYDFDSGERFPTWLGTGPYAGIVTNGPGDIVYAWREAAPPRGGEMNRQRITFAREGDDRIWFRLNIAWTEDDRPAIAVDRRGESALIFTEHAEGGFQGHLVDPDAPGDPSDSHLDIFVPVPELRVERGDPLTLRTVADGAMLVGDSRDEDNVVVLSAADATELHRLDDSWRISHRRDGRVALTGSCVVRVGEPCRELRLLSADQQTIEQEYQDDGALDETPWPYGPDGDTIEVPEGTSFHRKHLDAAWFGAPCLLQFTADQLRCR